MNSIYDVIDATVSKYLDGHKSKTKYSTYVIGLIGEGPVEHHLPTQAFSLISNSQENLQSLAKKGLSLEKICLKENEGVGMVYLYFNKGYSKTETHRYNLIKDGGRWIITNSTVSLGVHSSSYRKRLESIIS